MERFQGGLSMSVQNDTDVAKNQVAPAASKTKASAIQLLTIATMVLGAVALASYQFFYCAGCFD
jgi:hypothetical protein